MSLPIDQQVALSKKFKYALGFLVMGEMFWHRESQTEIICFLNNFFLMWFWKGQFSINKLQYWTQTYILRDVMFYIHLKKNAQIFFIYIFSMSQQDDGE